jgi:hypothetical protein
LIPAWRRRNGYEINYDGFQDDQAGLKNAIEGAFSITNNVIHEICFNSMDIRRPSLEDTETLGFIFKNITISNKRFHKLGFIKDSFNDILQDANYLVDHAANYQKVNQLEFQDCGLDSEFSLSTLSKIPPELERIDIFDGCEFILMMTTTKTIQN